MTSTHHRVAIALAVALLVGSVFAGTVAADHGSTHTIELYGDATYVDGTSAGNQTIALVEANSDGTYTTLDSTTPTADGEIANQSTGVGTPLSATVANGTELRVHLNGNTSATEFPAGELIKTTNQTGTYHVEAVFDTGQQISEYHSATLEADDGTVLASWYGSDYVDTTEPTPDPEPKPEPESYWSYPDKPTENDTVANETVEEAELSWFERIFGGSNTDEQPSWFNFDSLWERLRGGGA